MLNKPHHRTKSENPAATKSFAFSLQIIRTCQKIQSQSEFVLSRQLLRSGTSIGANVEEALGAFSKREFAAKMGIAYKEARESEYWIRLLNASSYLSDEENGKLMKDIGELLRILGAILRTLRKTRVQPSTA
jgi:four helix bundle protein